MSIAHTFDIIVQGAGPAGTIAAIKLQQLGYSVAVLSQPSRYPSVIEGISQRTFSALENIGLDSLCSVISPAVPRFIDWGERSGQANGERLIYREVFNAALERELHQRALPLVIAERVTRQWASSDNQWQLVADDAVYVSQMGGELSTRAKDFARGYLEMRGIGIINVANLYGLSAIRPEKRLDLVVELKPETDLNKVDRLGMKQKKYKILDTEVPLIEIPVAPGRDTARLVGVAALNLQLKRLGYDMAEEFNKRLQEELAGN